MLKPILKLLTLICFILSYAAHHYVENNKRPDYDTIIQTECDLISDEVYKFPDAIRNLSKREPMDYTIYAKILKLLAPITSQTSLVEIQHIHTILSEQFSSYIEYDSWVKAEKLLQPQTFFCPNEYNLAILQGLSDRLSDNQSFANQAPQLIITDVEKQSDEILSIEYIVGYSYNQFLPHIKFYNGTESLATDKLPIYFPYKTDSLRIEITNPVTGDTTRIYAQP